MAYDKVLGRNRLAAQKALALAEERGFDTVSVVAARGGYLVPVKDGEEAVGDIDPDTLADPNPVEEIEQPTTKWNAPDIRSFAEGHGIDLGEATTKKDMLAVIAAAKDKEE